jgi:hypothetical protein
MSPRRVPRRASARPVPAIAAGTWAAAGNVFRKLVQPPPVPLAQYTQKATGIMLTGGQNAGPISAAGTLTLSVGPQGYGVAWYPSQVTISTTTGALDTSTALVYLGVGGVPTTLVATVYSGNGVVALAVPAMAQGDLIIVQWTGAHYGDMAAMNVTGTQDALVTSGGY